MTLNTSTQQNVELIRVILRKCKESNRVSEFTFYLSIKDAASILDGRPLLDRSNTYEEKLRVRNFGKFCERISNYLVLVKMLTIVVEVIDSCGYPTEIGFLRITKSGNLFLRFPRWLQVFMVYLSVRLVSMYLTVKR